MRGPCGGQNTGAEPIGRGRRGKRMLWYVIASLTPAVLIAAAALWGGVWPVLALLSITVHVAFMDRLGRALRLSDSSGRALTLTLAAAHFLLLPLGVWAIGAAPHLEGLDRALIFAALGLFLGQISNSNAHELIHCLLYTSDAADE